MGGRMRDLNKRFKTKSTALNCHIKELHTQPHTTPAHQRERIRKWVTFRDPASSQGHQAIRFHKFCVRVCP